MKARWIFLCFAAATLAGAQEKPPDPFGKDNPPPLGVGLIAKPGVLSGVEVKLQEIRIPLVEFVETPLEDALEYLRARSEELDLSSVDPAARGINIVTRLPPGWAGPGISLGDEKPIKLSIDDSPRITLKLKNASLGSSIRYVARAAGLEMHVEPEAVVLMPPGEETVASLAQTLSEASVAMEGWDKETLRTGNSQTAFPKTSLLEALQLQYRQLKALEERVRKDPAQREAVARRLEATDRALEKARKMLLDHWEAERELGEAWQAEVAR